MASVGVIGPFHPMWSDRSFRKWRTIIYVTSGFARLVRNRFNRAYLHVQCRARLLVSGHAWVSKDFPPVVVLGACYCVMSILIDA
jgi:hypothetical protein